jgi:hypothetical protein
MKWRQASGTLCNKKVLNKQKDKFYRTAIGLAIKYGVECWATKWQNIQKMSVAEMRMLHWICGHTIRANKNDDIHDKLGVASIQEKLIQHCLRWFDHIQRRSPELPILSGIISRPENTRRERGRLRLTWEEAIKKDFKKWNISKDLDFNRSAWKTTIHVSEL